MPARRRSPIARRSPAPPRSITRTRSRPAAPASMPASRSASSRCRPASGSCLRTRRADAPRRSGLGVENEVVGGAVPKEYVPGVEKGLRSSTENGVLAGFPVIDLKAELTDGAYHDVDSSVLAFEIAARAA